MAVNASEDTCQVKCVHEDTVRTVRDSMHPGSLLMDLADLFKVLGDFTRVRILHALSLSEMCVCDLATLLSLSPSAVSHQLRVLRSAKIVKFRREGKNVFYTLDDEHVFNLMREGLEHTQE